MDNWGEAEQDDSKGFLFLPLRIEADMDIFGGTDRPVSHRACTVYGFPFSLAKLGTDH